MQKNKGIEVPISKSSNLGTKCFCFAYLCSENNMVLSRSQRNQRKGIMNDLRSPSQIQLDSEQENALLHKPTIEILKCLYLHQEDNDRNKIFEALKNKRINPIPEFTYDRQDIQYYVPQLITYLVFQQDLRDEELLQFLMQACQVHYPFAHSCYFYYKSISRIQGIDILQIQEYLQKLFLPLMNDLYRESRLYGLQLARCSDIAVELSKPTKQEIDSILKYGTVEQDQIILKTVKSVEIASYSSNGFMSTPDFWENMISIGQKLKDYSPKIIGLKTELRNINKKLPADVYIPFLNNSLRYYTILNIDETHAKVFSTKQRAPFSIYIEVFREEEQFAIVEENPKNKSKSKSKKKPFKFIDYLNSKLSQAFTVIQNQNSLKLKKLQHKQSILQKLNTPQPRQHLLKSVLTRSDIAIRKISLDQSGGSPMNNKTGSLTDENSSESESMLINQKSNTDSFVIKDQIEEIPKQQNSYFGVDFSTVEDKIRQKSIYKKLKTWKLINLMVKTGDNLKQEQFAMQLINQFNGIFLKEATNLLLRPYQVVSLGPDSGIIEMVTDSIPLSTIFKKMKLNGIGSLKQFFKSHFKSKYKQARQNFCRSLAAYSLVTYFLQIKDRHNQNILLHKDGYIVHIDFGFFLSNAPGQGIQLEKKVPFKLMSAYVDLLGGNNSFSFGQFRKLFEKGFAAALKHKEQIVTLVKMMYSSHGESLPCFQKGDDTIKELESRFQYPRDLGLSEHCQNLINESLDNWRARWYDKFQYFLQGIVY